MHYIVPETEAQRELETGETLLWSGRPDPKQLGFQVVLPALFGVFFAGFAVFWMVGASTATRGATQSDPMANIFPLFGIPFVLVGLGVMSTPVFMFRRAQSTVYAVTNRRVMVITATGNRSVKSYTPSDLSGLEYVEKPDGSGTLTFAQHAYRTNNGGTSMLRDQFVGIPDVRSVEKLIRDNLMPGQLSTGGFQR